jgi:hypothetical protein
LILAATLGPLFTQVAFLGHHGGPPAVLDRSRAHAMSA